jgi:ketosteroid isomerase-like protein
MRHTTHLAGLTCLLVGCAAPALPVSDSAAERAAVERAITTWFDSGLARGDTTIVGRGLTGTAAILEDSVWYDRAGFITLVQSFPTMVGGPFTLRYTLTDWRTAVQGNVAWTSLRNRAVLTPQKGTVMNLDWRETAVLTKGDGRWRIERYHSAPVRK